MWTASLDDIFLPGFEINQSVIPVKTGIYLDVSYTGRIPAFAGMTTNLDSSEINRTMKRNNKLQNSLKTPGTEFRSSPFWSLNDELEPKELTRQLDLMKTGGLGGQFMHSREGLITPYLSRKWMDCIKKTVEHSKKIGLLAYLYDEDRWPSGFAGGIATKNKQDRMKAVECIKANGKWKFKKITLAPSDWFNNTGYMDVFSKTAVKKFIDSTYELYKKTLGKEFNKTIPSIFTDELQYLPFPQKYPVLPWSAGFEEAFQKTYGYSITKNLIALVEKTANCQKIRYDFWKFVSAQFQENCAKQIYDWCDKNNIEFTGHFDNEDSLLSQMKATGGVMPLYEYMHMPGIDHLGRKTETHLLTIKQCASVAHQLGKKRVISEIYGGGGQNLSFADRKRVGDWDTVLGVNFFCPHLWLYSMRGCRKRDWPPTLSYQQPWWKYNKPLEDYFAHINELTSRGKFQPDMLILHPIESAWVSYNPDLTKNKTLNDLNDKLNTICRTIIGNHYDFDFGDESLIAKYGKVNKENGKACFSVGEMKYPMVALPPMLTIRKTTLSLIEAFLNSGGKVIAIERLPNLIEGKSCSKELQILNNIKVYPINSFIRTIENTIPKEISVTDKQGREIPEILCQKRILSGNKRVYFLANSSQNKTFNAQLKSKNNTTNLNFHPAGSHILSLHGKKLDRTDSQNYKSKLITSLTNNWKLEKIDYNAITLDTCHYKLQGQNKWSHPVPVIKLQSQLEKLNKIIEVSLRFEFKTNFKSKPQYLFLALEQPEIFQIKINGNAIKHTDTGWWIDTSFKKVHILDHITPNGTNIIELNCRFIHPKKPKTFIFLKDGVELESIYITGDFAVKGNFKQIKDGYSGKDFILINRKDKTNPANMVTCGYPFFAGSATFRMEFQFNRKLNNGNIFLHFNKFQSTAAKIRLNNKEAGLIYLPPHELDITKLLKTGSNVIEIELTNTLRNLLGPHHYKEVNPAMVSPKCFFQTRAKPSISYSFIPFGPGKIELIHK